MYDLRWCNESISAVGEARLNGRSVLGYGPNSILNHKFINFHPKIVFETLTHGINRADSIVLLLPQKAFDESLSKFEESLLQKDC